MFRVPKCTRCKHLAKDKFACPAFPDSIPRDILYSIPRDILFGIFDHKNPYPNAEHPTDNGFRFESILPD